MLDIVCAGPPHDQCFTVTVDDSTCGTISDDVDSIHAICLDLPSPSSAIYCTATVLVTVPPASSPSSTIVSSKISSTFHPDTPIFPPSPTTITPSGIDPITLPLSTSIVTVTLLKQQPH